MLTSSIVNTSARMEILPGINTSNVSEVLLSDKKQGFDFKNHSYDREWSLLLMAMVSAVGYVLAFFVHSRYRERRQISWFCTSQILFVGILIGIVPMLSQVLFEPKNHTFIPVEFTCELYKVRTFFLTLMTYILVGLALNCYNIVVKPFVPNPMTCRQLVAVLGTLYFLSSMPSMAIHIFGKYFDADAAARCIPYYYFLFRFSQQIKVGIILVFTYIIPTILMLTLLLKVFYDLWMKTSWFYPNKQTSLKISRSDGRFILLAFSMCLIFVLVNLPFIIQTIILVFVDPNLMDADTAISVEMLSTINTSINPYIYFFIHHRRAFRHLVYPPVKPDSDINQNAIHRGCYEPVVYELNKGDFVNLNDKAPQPEVVKLPLDY